MGVILTVNKQKAFLRNGEWRSADQDLETQLNKLTEEWILETGGPGLHSIDPETEVARAVAKKTGGRILLQSKSDARKSARIYFARRQYRFAFD